MAKDELDAFRDSWQKEITCKREEKRVVSLDGCSGRIPDSRHRYFKDVHNPSNEQSEASTSSDEHPEEVGCINGEVDADQPEYVSIASSLLDGRTGPLLDRIQRERTLRKRQYHNMTAVCSASLQRQQQQQQQPQSKVKKDPQLLDQLIQDLNDVDNIPFFDTELPYEVALKIFQHLNCTELGRCAQVSRAWRALAEDRALWFKICVGEGYHQHANMSDSPCWKSALRDCRNSAKTLRFNWKNRVGSISQLQFELGKILCDVSSSDQYVVAGYTSGDVRLWDTLHWDLAASYLKTNSLSANATPRPHVAHVRVNSTVAAAAYEDGCVDLWSTETGGEPLHHYQTAGGVQALALSSDAPILASAAGPQVRLDRADDHGYWRTLCQTQLPDSVESLVLVPDRGQQHPLAAVVAGDAVYLLDHLEEEPRLLHSVYGQPITCLDASNSHVAFGVKRTGWAMHDGGNKIHIYSLETGKSVTCVGGVPGVFTCISLRDSAPHLLLCGNKDRRVSMFDLRTGSSVGSRDAHHLGVTAVQGDDWKVVSGGREGLVCVWELRMDTILWEMHNRHPVRHLRFNTSTLVTANIPDDKSPRGACITDDDLTAHRRHRGVICRYDFSEDSNSQDHILPICRSNYTESNGYNYNIRLTVPYDRLSGSHPSH